MGSDNPNHHDQAAELHAGIVRRLAREHRKRTRDYVIIYADRDMEPNRIAELLDVDLDVVNRALTVDGRRSCPECVYGRHITCEGYHYHDALYVVACECSCRKETA